MRQRYSLHHVSAYAGMRRWGKSLPGRVLTYFTLFCLNLSFIPAAYAQVDEPYFGLEEPIEYNSLSTLDLTSSQLGLDGPFSFGMGYGSLDRYSVNAQYTKEIDEDLAMSVLAEYGEEMYRLGATIGFSVLEHGLAKVSAERFSQLLPFEFDSGNIDEDVAQNAYGIRYQHSLDNNFMRNINFGAYYANAPNVALDPVIFDVGGVDAINYRNIAGATSTGLDMGSSFRLSPSTELSAQIYYDDVRYNTEFTDDSSFDGSGLGGELGVKQLLSDRIAVSAVGSVRELYDVYTVGISWLPPSLPSAEVALLGQRIVSQNETPDNNIVGLQVGFDFGLGGTGPRYALSNLNTSKDIEQWTSTPAVYMEQVLAISEQYSEFLSGSKVSEDATLTSTEPVITSISETTGPVAGGTELILLGTGFTDAVEVKFGEELGVDMVVVDDTQITVTTPAGEEGVVNVSVATPVGISEAQEENQFKYAVLPTVTARSPTSGAIGTIVTITGTNFTGTTNVSFGGVPATNFTVNSNTQIIATVPCGSSTGTVTITVTNGTGTSAPNPPSSNFNITAPLVPTISSIVPNSGPAAGGTSVTITGTRLSCATAVNFGAAPATTYTVNSATTITVTSPSAPSGAGLVDVRVTTPGGTSAITANDRFTYAPTVTGVSPNTGSDTGGTIVTLTGTGFIAGATVSFGGTPGTNVIVVNATTITVTSPAHADGVVNITVTTSGGTSPTSPSNQFTYTPPVLPTVTGISPTFGPAAGGTVVTITGTNFLVGATVKFGTAPATGIVVNSSTQITATSPAGTAPVNVTVTTPGGTSTQTATFTYGPRVTAVAPNTGSNTGGTIVTLTGTGFTGATAVNFGTTPATSFTVNSATSITVTSPARANGLINITVITPAGTSPVAVGNRFTYVNPPLPTVTAVTPNSGPAGGGTSVTVTGTNFLVGLTTVNFGSNPATGVVVNSPTSLTATSPAGAGLVDVRVTTPGGTSAITANDRFTYIPAPTVTGIAPTSGPETGATSVTITGTNFTGATAVKFGATPATTFTVNSATQIIATSPVGTGTVHITVTTPGGTSATSAADQFTYIPAPTVTGISPTSGPEAGGTNVTITGTNFTGATAVKFGAVNAASFTVNSATQITATSPIGIGTVDITVTTLGGTSATSAADQYTYLAVPTAATLTPSSGPLTGVSVTIAGSGFVNGATTVQFGTTTIPANQVTFNSSTSIAVTAPSVASAQTANVTVSTNGGTTTPALIFTYYAAPTITSVNPNQGSVTGGTLVEITGTDFVGVSGAAAVKFGGNDATIYTVDSPTKITALAPAGVAGTVDISVTAVGGTSSVTVNDQFTYYAVPTITSVNPNQGPLTGGTSVEITGTDFVGMSGAAAVKFGGNNARSYTVDSPTKITAVAPAGVAGTVDISVTAVGGTSLVTVNDEFTYEPNPTVSSLSPVAGPLAGGTLVTITGTGFVPSASVSFGSNPGINVIVIDSNTIKVSSPAGSGPVNVTVTTPGGTSAQTVTFTYEDSPTVTNLSPNFGSSNGGTIVTITGTNFVGVSEVKFGTNPAVFTFDSATQITATSPSHADGVVNVTVTTPVGTSLATVNNEFTYNPLISIAVTPTHSSIGSGTNQPFTAIGTYLDGDTKDITAFVNWTSANSGIASVSSSGVVQGNNPGTTTIFAEDNTVINRQNNSIIGSTSVTVVALPTSSAADLDSTRAMNTPIQAMRNIATQKIVQPLEIILEVSPDDLIVGETTQVYATGYYGDLTQDITDWVTWKSLDPNVAMVDNEGNITALAPGEAQIVADFVELTQTIKIKVVSEAMAILKPKQTWAVQVGAFSNVNNALNLLERLHEDGYTGYVENVEDKNLIRVLVGETDEASQENKASTK